MTTATPAIRLFGALAACARCGTPQSRRKMRHRVVFMPSATARVYCVMCSWEVVQERPQWAFCDLPRTVRS